MLCDNPKLERSNGTSNDHVSNFAETHRHLWQRGLLLFITRVVRRLRLDHRRPERRDFNLGTFLGTRNRGLCVSGPLLDRSLSKPFLDQRTLFNVQDELIFVLLEHVLLYIARNVVAGNLYHQLLRHFSIHEISWNNLADLGTFSINRLTQTDEWLQVRTMSNFDFVARQRCGAPNRRCSLVVSVSRLPREDPQFPARSRITSYFFVHSLMAYGPAARQQPPRSAFHPVKKPIALSG